MTMFNEKQLSQVDKKIAILNSHLKTHERTGLEIPRCYFGDNVPTWIETLYTKIWREFMKTDDIGFDDTFRWEMDHIIGLIADNGAKNVLSWSPKYMVDANYTEIYTYPLFQWAMAREFLVTDYLNKTTRIIAKTSPVLGKPSQITSLDAVFMRVQAGHFSYLAYMLAASLSKVHYPR